MTRSSLSRVIFFEENMNVGLSIFLRDEVYMGCRWTLQELAALNCYEIGLDGIKERFGESGLKIGMELFKDFLKDFPRNRPV